ncbi:hypothetical protein [Streptomyces griseoaurantiacus]|uniref:Uncharacterized protein n=1 Tax=Streptomyces griseoaurantiacus TaxID=68213 RepID=A0A7W2HUL7_9ACTN|nr:hypothetical protein [Streptomyces griseoaurantiacus]MBA5222204.1 hypothetical protein [Streptomyces griseoaurantiacus]
MFAARDTETGHLWFRLQDCAARFGSMFCAGWRDLKGLVRTDVMFLPAVNVRRSSFEQALVRDLGLVVLAEWNDPEVWLWMQGDGDEKGPPQLLADVYALVKEPHIEFQGKLSGRSFFPAPAGWRCWRCGRFPTRMTLSGNVDGIPLYACSEKEETACLTS